MNYSKDEFLALVAEVEDQGGMLLEDRCDPRDVTFTKPPYKKNTHTEKRITCGCTNKSRVGFPYDPEPDSKVKTGFATLCLVCDDVAMLPRFKGIV